MTMTEKIFLCLLMIFGGISIDSCSANEPGGRESQQAVKKSPTSKLQRYELADPASDLRAALKAGDTTFLAVTGYTLTVPGIPDFKSKYSHKYHYRVIEGTSEFVPTASDLRLQVAVRRYAETYNRLLLRHLQSRH
jgi:hypothetical protein